jgi:hypothetical protein
VLNNLGMKVSKFEAKSRSGWTNFNTHKLDMTVREALKLGDSRLRKVLISQCDKFTKGKKGR